MLPPKVFTGKTLSSSPSISSGFFSEPKISSIVYEEYKRSPKVTKERIYLETMDEIFGSEKKPELIDGELDNVLPVKTLGGNN